MLALDLILWLALGGVVLLIHLVAVSFTNALRSYSRSRLEELCLKRGHPERADEVSLLNEQTETGTSLISVVTGLLLAAILGGLLTRTESRLVVDLIVVGALVVGGLAHLSASIYGRVLAEDLLDRGWSIASLFRRLIRPAALLTGWIESFVEQRVRASQPYRIGPRPASVEVEIHDRSEADSTILEAEMPDSTRDMLESVVSLANRDAASVMTPRSGIKAISASTCVRDAAAVFSQTGLSRIPVYGEHRDDVIGVLYLKDLLPVLLDPEAERHANVRKLAREAFRVPESKNAAELLEELRLKHVQVALVYDEYGSLVGLATLEDLLEEIVGPIDDEHDLTQDGKPIVALGNGGFEVDGSVDLELLNEELQLDLPTDGDYQTVGGLAFEKLGRVPDPGATFQTGGCEFTVLEVGDHAVRRVRLSPITASGKARE